MASNLEFVPFNDFVEGLSEASEFASSDKSIVSNSTNGPRKMPKSTEEKLFAESDLVDANVKRITSISSILDDDAFEPGNISISDSGWTYNDFDSSVRLRTKKNISIKMSAGDYISIVYPGSSFYIGIKNSSSEYSYQSWNTKFVAAFDCEIVILILLDFEYSSSDVPNIVSSLSCSGGVIVRKLNEDVNKIIRFSELFNSVFEIGNISMSSSARTYSQSTTRVRSKQGYELFLKAGDVIGMEDYTDLRFYVSGSPLNVPKFTVAGWLTEDYTAPFDGYYSILVSNRTEVNIDLNRTIKMIKIVHEGNTVENWQLLSTVVNELKKNKEKNSFIDIDFEIGTFDRSGGKIVYADRTDRFRTAQGRSVFLNQGAKVKLSSYSLYRLCVFEVDDKTEFVKNYYGWLTADFTIPSSGYYVFLIDCNGINVATIDNWRNVIVFEIGGFDKQSISQLYNRNASLKILEPVQSFLKNADESVISVNHRGYNSVAPENTLPAFRLSASNGFKWVETDIHTTSDNKLVCIHDSTVDRTSDGTGNVADMTLEQLKELDFGSWKSTDYAGTKIPTFEEFLICCKNLGLCAVVEKKSVSGDNIKKFFDTIMNCGMFGRVMVIEASHVMMDYAFSNKIMIPCGSLTRGNWTVSNGVSSNSNVERSKYWRNLGMPAFTENDYDKITADMLDYCKANDLPMAVCTPDSESDIISADPYIFQVTSNLVNAAEVLRENELNS